LYAFFWVITRRLDFICQRFGTPCLFHLHRQAYEDRTECSETSAYKIQTPGNYSKERTKHTEHGKSLKSGTLFLSGNVPLEVKLGKVIGNRTTIKIVQE